MPARTTSAIRELEGSPQDAPRFLVDVPRPLIDEPVAVRLVGLSEGQVARITASCVDTEGVSFSSWADYQADGLGVIDPSRHPALRGTYEGADAFGPWWSMAPAKPAAAFAGGIEPVTTRLTASVGGKPVAQTTLDRLPMADSVRASSTVEAGLRATLFCPAGGPRPAIIVLGGSGGGFRWSLETAALCASHGLCALALAYFDVPGLPTALVEVPLEYVETAVSWLLARPEVAGDEVTLMGSSRGAELALLVAATSDRVGAVVAFAPSALVWPGFDPASNRTKAAWTQGGRPLPHAGAGEVPAAAIIPVERIRGAVLLVSGGDDRMWPAGQFSEMVMTRLGGGRRVPIRARSTQHLHYPAAGHMAGRPPGPPASAGLDDHPLLGRAVATGGTQPANAASSLDAWPRILGFLQGPSCSSGPSAGSILRA